MNLENANLISDASHRGIYTVQWAVMSLEYICKQEDRALGGAAPSSLREIIDLALEGPDGEFYNELDRDLEGCFIAPTGDDYSKLSRREYVHFDDEGNAWLVPGNDYISE